MQQPLEIPPTLPPAIRGILRLSEAPALRPRRPERRRLSYAGPAAPRSWVSTGAHLAAIRKAQQYGESQARKQRPLPGTYLPPEGSLVGIALKQFAIGWSFQKSYCRYCLYDLPTHLRVALLTYLSIWNPDGVSLADLQLLLLPPVADDDKGLEDPVERLSPSSVNELFHHLDVTGSLGRSLHLRELSNLIFPRRSEPTDPQDSWDAPESAVSVPRPLLPNLTHLSLGIHPERTRGVSWRHLLSFVSNCPTLTHLSLAFWPVPSLTPNAELASFVTSEGRAVQYAGTGPYSRMCHCSPLICVLLGAPRKACLGASLKTAC